MKKILILLSVIFLGISSSLAQAYTVNVSWNDSECIGSIDYFRVGVAIIDAANNYTVAAGPNYEDTPDETYSDIDVDMSDLSDYCSEEHEKTPSFIVQVHVQAMPGGTPSCHRSWNYSYFSCDDFSNGLITLTPAVPLLYY